MIYETEARAQEWANWLTMSTGAEHVVRPVPGGYEIHRVNPDAHQLIG